MHSVIEIRQIILHRRETLERWLFADHIAPPRLLWDVSGSRDNGEKEPDMCVHVYIYIYVYILIPRRLLVRFIEARTIVRSKGTFDTGGKAFHRVIKLATSRHSLNTRVYPYNDCASRSFRRDTSINRANTRDNRTSVVACLYRAKVNRIYRWNFDV